MDTLVIGADDRMPMSFQRKFLSVPESNLVVAGTGHAGFINGWFEHLQANRRGATIDELNAEVPSIFHASVSAEGGLGGLTVTIYHFGYSAREHRYAGYASSLKSAIAVERCVRFPWGIILRRITSAEFAKRILSMRFTCAQRR